MRLSFLYSALILLAVLIFASCNAVDTVATHTSNQNSNNSNKGPATYPDGARRVTSEELENLIKENKAYIVDVRNQAMYDTGHIPGSHLIPAAEILNHLNELPKDKTIVTYCS